MLTQMPDMARLPIYGDRCAAKRASPLPFHNLDLLRRQLIQLVHQLVDLLIRHIDLALQAITRSFAVGRLLLPMQIQHALHVGVHPNRFQQNSRPVVPRLWKKPRK